MKTASRHRVVTACAKGAKRLTLFALTAFVAGPAWGQGLVDFNNYANGARAPVYDEDGATPLDSSFLGQLYAGAPDMELLPVGSAVPFRDEPGTGAGTGYILAGSVTLPGIAPGEPAEVQLRAWHSGGGATYEEAEAVGAATGMSTPFTLDTAGPAGSVLEPPQALFGLQSFSLHVPTDKIGVNFEGRNPFTPLDPAASAGLTGYEQGNWNNAPHSESTAFDGTVSFLQSAFGANTTVDFVFNFSDGWNSASGTATPNQKLMNGIQKINPNPNDNEATSYATARFEGLLPGSVYDVIAYLGNDGANAKGYARIGGTSYYLQQESGWSGSWIRSTLTTEPAPGGYPTANYVQFEGVVPDGSGAIEIEFKKLIEVPELVNGFGVAGIQLVKTAGDWPILADPPVITEELHDVLATVGDEVTLTVGTDGPWTITWYRLELPHFIEFQSGPETSYTFTTTAADKGAMFIARVTNPVGSTFSTVATLTLDDPLPEQLVQGFLRVEHYAGIPGTVVRPDFYNQAVYQNRAYNYEFFIPGAQTQADDDDAYARIVEGWVKPDEAGDYHFFLQTDDNGELFINPIGVADPALEPGSLPSDLANLAPDAFVPGWSDTYFEPGSDQTTGLFPLDNTLYYGLAAVQKDYLGGDHFRLAWRESGDLTPAAQLTPIPAQNCYCLARPSGKRASITQHPQDISVDQYQTTTFTVAVETLPDPSAFTVQWTVNGEDIPGAHGTSYTTPALDPTHDGNVYRARVYTLIGELLSDPATLMVFPDSTPPDLVSAGAYSGGTLVGLSFSEPVYVVWPFTYNFSVDGVTVTGVEHVSADGDVVLLTVDSPPAQGAHVWIDRTAICDRNYNDLYENSTAVHNPDLSPGILLADPGDPGTRDPLNDGRSVPLGGGGMYLEAGGSDIWNNADAGHYAYKTYTGPFSMRMRVQNLTGPNHWTKAGIMVRETLDGGSRHVMAVATRKEGVNCLYLQWRDANGAVSGHIPVSERITPVPYPGAWLRIDRPGPVGNRFEVFLSPDGGVTWDLWQEHTLPGPALPETVYVGMAATAHDNSPGADPATTVMRGFDVAPWLDPALPRIATYAVVPSGSVWEIIITWNEGELEAAPSMHGPWTPTGNSSGTFIGPVTQDHECFRVRID